MILKTRQTKSPARVVADEAAAVAVANDHAGPPQANPTKYGRNPADATTQISTMPTWTTISTTNRSPAPPLTTTTKTTKKSM